MLLRVGSLEFEFPCTSQGSCFCFCLSVCCFKRLLAQLVEPVPGLQEALGSVQPCTTRCGVAYLESQNFGGGTRRIRNSRSSLTTNKLKAN